MRPDDGPEADTLAPRRPPEPIATPTPAPVAEIVTVERWCPNPRCAVDSWHGGADSLCRGCAYPGVSEDESSIEARRRIVAEMVG